MSVVNAVMDETEGISLPHRQRAIAPEMEEFEQ